MKKLVFVFLIAINSACFGQIVLSVQDTIQSCLDDTINICVTANTNISLTYYWKLEPQGSSFLMEDSTSSNTGSSCNALYCWGDYINLWVYATDGVSISDSVLVIIEVNYLPTPSFGVVENEGCAPFEAFFSGSASMDRSILVWDFNGDGTADHSDSILYPWPYVSSIFTYTEPGAYTVIVTVISEKQCSTTVSLQDYINVFPSSVADYITSFVSSGPFFSSTTLEFASTSLGVDSLLIWDFGDGQTSNDPNPTHTFTGGGPFNVTLQAINVYGCSSFREKIITVSNGNITEQIINGVEEVQTNSIEIFPNPTSGVLTIKNNKNSIISVYNALGINVGNFKLADEQLDLSYLDNGIYFLQIATKDKTGISTVQIIK